MFKRFAAVSFLLAVASAYGQLATTTSLVGNVTDSAGAPMAGVAITAVLEATQDTYTATTNDTGFYQIQFVKVGTFTLSAKQAGFQQVKKTGVVVETNQIARTDFTLQIGQVTETLTVNAAAPPISTDDPTLSETINTRAAADLPLNGRDPLQLAVTTPGVLPGRKAPAGNPGGGEGFIGAGTREIQNSVSLDGVSIMSNLISTTTIRPSVEAVQEVQIQTGTYPAQYGGYMGLQLNLISKSGTNSLHGSVVEFVRNNYFDARGFFNAKGKPQAPFHQNQFGFELAGPVVIPKLYDGRNKTFFMVDYEGLRNVSASASITTELTPLMRMGNFSELFSKNVTLKNPFDPAHPAFPGNIVPASLISSQAVKALQYAPLPNLPGPTNNFLVNVPSVNNTDQALGRLDQNIGDKARLFFRYVWENATLVNNNTNPFNGYNQPVTDRNFVVGYTQVFSPSTVNDFRFGRQHTTIDSVNFFHTAALATAGTSLGIPGVVTDLANSGLPNLAITNYDSIGGGNMASTNWYQTDTTWQGSDVFSWVHGAHAVSAGAEIRKLITLRTANNNPRGGYNFTGQYSGDAAADFVLGALASVTTPGPLFPGGAEEYRDGFFVMDKWQVRPKLTLSIGLRYELTTVPESATGNGTILDPTLTHFIPTMVPSKIPFNNPNHTDFAPRFGFAYRATDKWVVRGGYGIYYNSNQLNTYTLSSTNPPFSTISTYVGDIAIPSLTLSNPAPAVKPGASAYISAFGVSPYLPTAYMNQWSFDLERGLWRGAGLDVQYLGSHSVHLDRSYYPNTPLPGPGNINARRPNQLFGSIRIIQNDEDASYNSLNVILRMQTYHGLSGLFSYVYAHALDVTTDSNGGGAPMNPLNWKQDYASANWDVRQRFVGSWVYELPFFKEGPAALRKTLGGWQLNGIGTVQTGYPFTVNISNDQANNGQGNQRPNIVGNPKPNCGQGHLSNCISSSASSDFAVPALYTFGSLGRNTFRGPDFINFDTSLFKNIRFRERATLQIRGEFFNVFNHPSFSNPGGTLTTSSSGTISASNFGNITSTSNNPRQIQLGARITF